MVILYCSKCGKLIPEGSKFCPSCGTAVSGDQEQPMNAGTTNGQPSVQPNIQPNAQQNGSMFNQQPNGPSNQQINQQINQQFNRPANQPYVQQKKSNSKPIIIAVVAVVLLAIICIGIYVKNSNPRNVILGKWKATSNGITLDLEFKSDNTLVMTNSGKSLLGSYEFSSDNKTLTIYESTEKTKGDFEKAKLEIVNKDTVKLTIDSEVITMNRIK